MGRKHMCLFIGSALGHIEDKVKKLNFDIFVVGDDWAGKYDYLREQGVDVVYFPYGAGVSSTNLKKRMSSWMLCPQEKT